MTRGKLSLVAVLVILILLGAGGFYWYTANGRVPSYRTASVERGELLSTISATGTLNAVVTVQVGTQVSGTIQQLFVDFNSPVKKGMLVARIDPATVEAKANQAQADLENSRAAVLNQRAAVAKAQAELANARANVVRQEVGVRDAKIKFDSRVRLFQEGGISQEERDSAKATYDSAVAQVDAAQAGVQSAQAALEVTHAQLASAEAQVRQKQAALAQASVDLNNTYIRAPVDGVVVSRNVDVGQTVAASLQAPTLFLIAQDLTKMQVDTNVDEADIGRVALEQEATFTVDSYPGQTFRGRVMQIRQAPQVVQNVVTYNTVVAVSNLDHKLKPGMTANVKLLVARRENALLVPNAVFRFRLDAGTSGSGGERPGGSVAAGSGQLRGSAGPAGGGEGRAAGGSSRAGAQGMSPGASRGPEGMGQPTEGARQRIYVLADGKPTERQVKTGLSDGQRTEILEGLNEGDTVIVGTGQQRSGPNTQGGPRLRL